MVEKHPHLQHNLQDAPDTQSVTVFDRAEFLDAATDWGATPLKSIPEQAEVLKLLLTRMDINRPASVSDLAHEFMKATYAHRFHQRQDRNGHAYEMRLNKTPYENLPVAMRERRDRAMVSAATIDDLLLLQDEQQVSSLEIARGTFPYIANDEQRLEKSNEILQGCFKLDDATQIPQSETRWKIRGSDIISLPDVHNMAAFRPQVLFITSKKEIAYMPKHDTMVNERRSYVLDLAAFAEHEPLVANVLRQYDVHKLGRDGWSNKLSTMWREIDEMNPLFTEATRSSFYDMSTTFYTYNQRRMESIANREALIARRKRPLESPELLAHLREARQQLGATALSDSFEK